MNEFSLSLLRELLDRSVACRTDYRTSEIRGETSSREASHHITNAGIIGAWFRLVVWTTIRIGIARDRIGNVDRRNGRGRAGKIWAGIYGNRHGQSSWVDHVKHVSGHNVPGRTA